MKKVNIYALTRVENMKTLSHFERQLSMRGKILNVKQWELRSLRQLADKIYDQLKDARQLDFFYSFAIPKIGKEFDLLRISDQLIINIELKSEDVGEEKIKSQLVANRSYLTTMGRAVHSYTYISSTDRLVRLTKGGRLVDTEFETLIEDILKQSDCYDGHAEDLFREEDYIISPFADPKRFLNGEYFLTSQQKDIKKKIIRNQKPAVMGFTGSPGTGKTLLLYDIAMSLSKKHRVCIIHCGPFSAELTVFNERLNHIDLYQNFTKDLVELLTDYKAILIDEAGQIDRKLFDLIRKKASETGVPLILSYDNESGISKDERPSSITDYFESMPGYTEYRLTNRIRANSELSSFIHCLMKGSSRNHRKYYPNVNIMYANNEVEAVQLLKLYIKEGYVYLADQALDQMSVSPVNENLDQPKVDIVSISREEFDSVLMVIDRHFYYDEKGFLRWTQEGPSDKMDEKASAVMNLFRGLSRAKKRVAILVVDNEKVLETILSII